MKQTFEQHLKAIQDLYVKSENDAEKGKLCHDIFKSWQARTCIWTYDEANEHWNTDCGRVHDLEDGTTPLNNGYTFCTYCGCKIVEAMSEVEK